jgi:hypothetical protein
MGCENSLFFRGTKSKMSYKDPEPYCTRDADGTVHVFYLNDWHHYVTSMRTYVSAHPADDSDFSDFDDFDDIVDYNRYQKSCQTMTAGDKLLRFDSAQDKYYDYKYHSDVSGSNQLISDDLLCKNDDHDDTDTECDALKGILNEGRNEVSAKKEDDYVTHF